MHLIKFSIGFLFFFITITLQGQTKTGNQLILFIQNGAPISEHFNSNSLEDLKAFAKAQDMALEVIDITKMGAPDEITLTPLLVFQNYKGRSFFKGRYLILDKIKNFIRTSKSVPQESIEEYAGKNPIWQNGKTLTRAKIKITPLAGDVADNFSQDVFYNKMRKEILRGFENFNIAAKTKIRKVDRTFYLNFYPYKGTNDSLYISMEIFSMFNCVDPIYVQYDQPIKGTFKKSGKVFQQAAKYLEQEVTRQISNKENGDAYEMVNASIPTTSWTDLDLDLPSKPVGAKIFDTDNFQLATGWTVKGPTDESTPMIQFAFLAPVDHYSGEVREMKGAMTLSENKSFKGATGEFKAIMNSFTMGDEQLDEYVLKYFKLNKFPEASFTFEKIIEEDGPISFGKTSKIGLSGIFKFLGITETINTTAQIEPIITDNGEVRLQVFTSFRIRLKERYGIDGPDGPDPAKDTVVFYLNFLMEKDD